MQTPLQGLQEAAGKGHYCTCSIDPKTQVVENVDNKLGCPMWLEQ